MIKFECNGCGKCCNSSITLTLNEYLEHLEHFPLIGIFEFEKTKNKLNPDMYFSKFIGGKEIYVKSQIITLSYTQKCLQLDSDNRCKIYNNRPKVCALYPVVIKNGINNIESGLISEKETSKADSADESCEGWDEQETDNIIFSNGSLTDNETIDIFKRRNNEDIDTINLMKEYFNEYISDEDVIEELSYDEKGLIIIYAIDLINFLYKKGIITEIEVDDAIKKQKHVFEKTIHNIECKIIKTETEEALFVAAKYNYEILCLNGIDD
jgi:Fe-S-cluster containining protein